MSLCFTSFGCSIFRTVRVGNRATTASPELIARLAEIVVQLEADGGADPDGDRLEELRDVLKEDPSFVEAHRAYQGLMIASGRREEVLEAYREQVNRRPRYGLGLWLYARLIEDPERKRTLLDRAEEADPALVWVPFARAYLDREEGDLRSAIDRLEIVVQRDEAFAQAWLCLEDLYETVGDLGQALDCYDKYLGLHPGDGDQRLNRAFLLLKNGSDGAAEREFESLLDSNPEESDAAMGFALVAWSQQKFERCARWLERAIEINPDRADYYYNLGIVYDEGFLNRPTDAIRAYRVYLEKGGEQTIRIQNWLDRLNASRSESD